MRRALGMMWLAMAATGCGDDEAASGPATRSVFDPASALTGETFYDLPLPSDERLSDDGTPLLEGFLNTDDNFLVAGMLETAQQHRGWAMMPVAYFRFDGPVQALAANEPILPGADAVAWIIDLDAGVPLPAVVATVVPEDDFVPSNLLAVAPRQGFVLRPDTPYGVVVTDALQDAAGAPVGAAEAFAARRKPTDSLYAPLWSALEGLGLAAERVVAATVFTTGDVVTELSELSEAVSAAFSVTIDDLAIDPDDGADHERFCELHGSVTFPQFQRGTPPFKTEGLFEMGADGLPIEQRGEVAPIVISLPNKQMPPGGFPLVMYFHGSGGLAPQVVDRGTVLTPGGPTTKGEGPAHVLAAHGLATVGSAHPVNPERLPGASDIAYLNFDNLKAMRDTFRQGVLEQRLYLDALLELTIDPAMVAACADLTLPVGETAFRFASAPIMATGQSMGGMYTNMIGATDARIEAVVPTGAGGFWSFFILETDLIGGDVLIPLVLGTDQPLTFMHPALSLFELGNEAAEPVVYMPRLARQPLAGHPVRPIYEPVGEGDSYFPTQLYDAIALAYGHQQAGDEVWDTMQPALSLAELDGIIPYPVTSNLTSDSGQPFTGVIVQYAGDGIYDPHGIYAQLDAVKHQYGCFFETFLATGVATVPPPAALGSACE